MGRRVGLAQKGRKHKKDEAHTDEAIGQVVDKKTPFIPTEMQKISHSSQKRTVDQVAQSPRKNPDQGGFQVKIHGFPVADEIIDHAGHRNNGDGEQ